MKKRKRITLLIVVLWILLCIPVKLAYKDGGTVAYKAVLWSYTKYHRIQSDDSYYEADVFRVFPFNFINNY